MSNFFVIFKKEIRETLNKQLIFSLAFTILIFIFLGQMIGSQIDKEATKEVSIALLDLDQTPTSNEIKTILTGLPASQANTTENINEDKNLPSKIKITEITETQEREKAIEIAKAKNLSTLIFIPQGFETNLQKGEKTKLEVFSIFKDFSLVAATSAGQIETIIQALNKSLSEAYFQKTLPNVNIKNILNPIEVKNSIVIKDKIQEGSPEMVIGLISSQAAFVPMILMIIIIYCGTIMITSMATEKENKTLETLLTMPIKRETIIMGKMAGAAVVGFLMAAVYMFGFNYYFNSMIPSEEATTTLTLTDLGLKMGPLEYLILGISIFCSILVALALSMFLGVFSEDTKSAQSMIAPIAILAMVPFFLLMFQDFGEMPIIMKIILCIIPFSHPILASRTLLFGEYQTALLGVLYLIILLGIIVFFLLKIFNTDKVLTAKFSFKKKR
ncbi:MAG TPA: ABC transporter permease [Candidatus Pacearchaeota archaeon]|nr:ABC transporter permease [Candidatus Pacearchaeota archaeon]HOK94079.1 ABC transporter permease [Candidatus Pacearchaeota archaeon]HPO75150.1 ABC transporter permease [Candidatus Pacearchaeota archaeon]